MRAFLAAICLMVASAAAATTNTARATPAPLPRMIRSGADIQLEVDGKPYLILGGELHNSSASSTAYMAPIWDKLNALNLNTVIGTVSWELMEPEPGKFDFTLVDDEIAQARRHDMRLVLIWFASYKNAESRFTPAWVRGDPLAYPRVSLAPDVSGKFRSRLSQGRPRVEITPFSDRLLRDDSHAFATLMRHIRETDPQHTVIMLQVENEVGLLGDSRDRSALAEAAWHQPVPPELARYMTRNKATLRPELAGVWARQGFRTKGTWAEVFGTDWQADQIFMAWYFGRFVDQVAAAGKQELALPMYANAWLGPQPGQDIAGKYPSGGPVAPMMDVWKAAAPAVDFLAPDIYVSDVNGTYNDFIRADNPLFPPETQPIVGSLYQSIGRPSSLGYSIFGIEDVPPDGQIAEAYRGLKPALAVIMQARTTDSVRGFALAPEESVDLQIGAMDVRVVGTRDAMKKALLDAGLALPMDKPPPKPQGRGLHGPTMTDERPSGVILALQEYEFLLMGSGFSAEFSLRSAPHETLELESADEGSFVDGRWVSGRRLNGDELYQLLPFDGFTMVRIKLMRPFKQH